MATRRAPTPAKREPAKSAGAVRKRSSRSDGASGESAKKNAKGDARKVNAAMGGASKARFAAASSKARSAPEQVLVTTRAAWRRWLEKHHATATGAWVVTYKKQTGKPRVEAAEIGEEALCFGWVDSRPGKLDDERSMLLVTPRKATSAWSRLNKQRVEKLEREGLMTAAGRRVIEAAKANGSWSKLDEVEEGKLPPDLLRAFREAGSAARPNFEAFPRSVKRSILEWIQNAKQPETRARRVAETARLAQRNQRANQWRSA